MLAYIYKQALDNLRLSYACFFTFGDINKQAQIKGSKANKHQQEIEGKIEG
jgi:hypothetical protein